MDGEGEGGIADEGGVLKVQYERAAVEVDRSHHGKNKQKRNDCRQVAVGMALDCRGLALAHDVFEGNIAETKTLEQMLDRLALPGTEAAKPVVILDAGFASEKNIALLKARGLGYVINITRGSRAKYAEAFAAGGFEMVPGRERLSPIEVKTIADPDNPDGSLVLCRSALRRQKESAMLSRAESRFLSDIAALRKRIEEARLKDPVKIERAIGRLQKKHPRVARFYTLCHADGTLLATRDQERYTKATELLGDYVLKTEGSLSASQT
jgi:transposase